MNNVLMPDHDDIDQIAEQLEAEVPWATCSSLLSHDGWCDVVKAIKDTCPKAYDAMKETYITPPFQHN